MVDPNGPTLPGAVDHGELITPERITRSNIADHQDDHKSIKNHSMILCAIDDLIFSIKMSTAARHLGAELFFERTATGIVPAAREKHPSLIIFDLNSRTLA